MTESSSSTLPSGTRLRSQVPPQDCWDLSKLFPSDAEWETGLTEFESQAGRILGFKGTLQESATRLRAALDFIHEIGQLSERLAYYAHLRVAEDVGNSASQRRMARYQNIATHFAGQSSFFAPEIQAIPDAVISEWMQAAELEPYQIYLHKLLRYKPHILTEPEERLLALQSEFSQTARRGFDALTDVDMEFGEIETPTGPRPLTHASYAFFIQQPDRAVRQQAYTQYLQEFHAHRHTLAALYNGSVQRDVYEARVRNYPSSIAAHLFDDDVPLELYDQLIATVHEFLPALHRYYDLRRRALKLDTLRLYDTRVPLVSGIETHIPYDDAVDQVVASLDLLGDEYVDTLADGLRSGWVDRYENKGKRSGAFSAGSYHGDPYILMNYKEEVLNDLFTLTHEAGHSMHSWYSIRHQPFQHYNYTIFVAEVASTFNEMCLADYLKQTTDDPAMRTYLTNKQVDDVLATLFRQTMFAEFEQRTHAMVEQNEPLTVDSLTEVYSQLLTTYFGPAVPLEEHSALEGLRVPHFYSAFYVYKYATGLAASMALHEQVRQGGAAERERYLNFLKSGGSQFPLEQLRDAGVDLTSPEPVRTALNRFAAWVDELETLLAL